MLLISLRNGQEVAIGKGLESGKEQSLQVQTGVYTTHMWDKMRVIRGQALGDQGPISPCFGAQSKGA